MPAKPRKLPDTASVAIPDDNGKLCAPSAARNGPAILRAIRGFVPASGFALEIASGTGEHMIRYAAGFPGVTWQPTDIDPRRLESITAWRAEANLTNILAPVLLDATTAGWAARHSGQDLIILSNLLHLISAAEAQTVISQSAQALAAGGVLLIYGPFLRGAEFASTADRDFHNSLRNTDIEIGYKSFQSIQNTQSDSGLSTHDPIDMPSSNMLLAARKPGRSTT